MHKITPGNVDDRIPVPELTKNIWGWLFGDKGYMMNWGINPKDFSVAETDKRGILEQLDKSYPADTAAGKMAIATEAIK